MAPTPVLLDSFREKLLRKKIAYTLTVKLVRTVEIVGIAKSAGYDGILIATFTVMYRPSQDTC